MLIRLELSQLLTLFVHIQGPQAIDATSQLILTAGKAHTWLQALHQSSCKVHHACGNEVESGSDGNTEKLPRLIINCTTCTSISGFPATFLRGFEA